MGVQQSKDVIGKAVLSQDGREIGQIAGFELDVEQWRVVSVQVKLKRALLEELNVKRPLVGSPTVTLPVAEFAGIGDSAVLRVAFADLGLGEPAAEGQG